MLISPTNERYYASFRFTFNCTNSIAKYEALVHGLKWAIKRGISYLQVFGDLEFTVNQVRGIHTTKNDLLKSYKHVVWDLIEGLEAFYFQSVPRNQNKQVDRLAAIGAQYDISSEINKDKGKNHVKFIVRPAIPNNVESWQVFDSD